MLLLWTITNRYFRKWAPIGLYYFIGVWLLFTNLAFRGKLDPDFFRLDNASNHDETIYHLIIIFMFMNYSTFLTTVVLSPFVIWIPFYLQLHVQSEIFLDPYTCEKLDDSARFQYI